MNSEPNPFKPTSQDIAAHAREQSISPRDAGNKLTADSDLLAKKLAAIASGAFSTAVGKLADAQRAAVEAEGLASELADDVNRIEVAILALARRRRTVARFAELVSRADDAKGLEAVAVESYVRYAEREDLSALAQYQNALREFVGLKSLQPALAAKLRELEIQIGKAEQDICKSGKASGINLAALVTWLKQQANELGERGHPINPELYELSAGGFIHVDTTLT